MFVDAECFRCDQFKSTLQIPHLAVYQNWGKVYFIQSAADVLADRDFSKGRRTPNGWFLRDSLHQQHTFAAAEDPSNTSSHQCRKSCSDECPPAQRRKIVTP